MDVKYNNFFLYGIKVTNNFNLLSQYENILPFGISCVSDDLIDPYLISDFINQRNRLYLLNSTEVKEIYK